VHGNYHPNTNLCNTGNSKNASDKVNPFSKGDIVKLAKFFITGAIAAASVAATAQSIDNSVYAEVGYTSINYAEPATSTTMGVLRLIVGKEISEGLAVEGMLGAAAGDGSGTLLNIPYTIKTNTMYGIYLKPKAKISPDFEVFGRLGWAASNLTASVGNISVSTDNKGVSYGAGLGYQVAKNIWANLDYMSYYDKDGVSGKGPTIGVSIKF
jgi:outer membrane immunogenic protein